MGFIANPQRIMASNYAEFTERLKSTFHTITSTDEDAIFQNSFDSLKVSFRPEACIQPTTADQIGPILSLANEGSVPVTVRGVGSSLTGSATPIKGGWVLDVSKLNHIKIDPINRIADVGCGAVVKDIQDAAKKLNLFYPPDPSSYKWCTIGGNIACNAGGLRCVKYGVTRDYILSLKGYLPTGEFVEWAKPVRKFATGFNIRDLWIGSEGMLGIITSASLKLIPHPQERLTFLLGFDSETDALNSVMNLLQTNITPSIIEFIDSLSVKGAEETVGKQFFEGLSNPSVLLLEIDGDAQSLKKDSQAVLDWANQSTHYLMVASNEEEAEELWTVRRKCSGAMFKLGDSKLNEDVVVPLHQLPSLMAYVEKLRNNQKVPIAVFGHAGDGNLHVNIMYYREDEDMVQRAIYCLDHVMEKVIELNGAISGEHGVGLAKSHFIGKQLKPVQLKLMQSIKKSFDPNGILNPGKWFEAFSPWEHKRLDHQFPWDKK